MQRFNMLQRKADMCDTRVRDLIFTGVSVVPRKDVKFCSSHLAHCIGFAWPGFS